MVLVCLVPARWETNEDYCKKEVLKKAPYNKGPRLLDIMDTTVLDYLMGTLSVCLCVVLSVCDVIRICAVVCVFLCMYVWVCRSLPAN